MLSIREQQRRAEKASRFRAFLEQHEQVVLASTRVVCPWPNKVLHLSLESAQRAVLQTIAAEARANDNTLAPYWCRAGSHWHIGHRSPVREAVSA